MLRQWRWRRLRRRLSANPAPPPTRPGDGAVTGGRLYLTGLADGDGSAAAAGLRQLLAAAEPALAPCGLWREGSSLRQLQMASLYLRAWLAARRHDRPEQWRLAAIARSLLAALRAITLPGGLPQIGEAPAAMVAPDPLADLAAEDRRAAEELIRQARLDDLEALRPEGWLRLDSGDWSGLWHCPPGGWPLRGSLTHQDAGAAELHWRGRPLLVDPGSPPPADRELRALYRSYAAHGGISLNGCDPYPIDRPRYDESFRRDIAGPPPELRSAADGVRLEMEGYGRSGGHRRVERHWRFRDGGLRIEDLVLGTGRPLIERRLITPWQVEPDGDAWLLRQDGLALRLSADQPIALHPARRWRPDGQVEQLTLILLAGRPDLPWHGVLTLQPAE